MRVSITKNDPANEAFRNLWGMKIIPVVGKDPSSPDKPLDVVVVVLTHWLMTSSSHLMSILHHPAPPLCIIQTANKHYNQFSQIFLFVFFFNFFILVNVLFFSFFAVDREQKRCSTVFLWICGTLWFFISITGAILNPQCIKLLFFLYRA